MLQSSARTTEKSTNIHASKDASKNTKAWVHIMARGKTGAKVVGSTEVYIRSVRFGLVVPSVGALTA